VPGRTALVVPVPAAEQLVAAFRARYDRQSVAKGIPPHVTVLFPFVPTDEVDRVGELLRSHATSLAGFDAQLDRISCFEQHVWLRPTPDERWNELILTTTRRFPGWPPYEGAFETVVAPLTVGEASDDLPTDALLEAAERELAPRLPLSFRVESLSLLVECADGTWSADASFPLG
jgi:2'-5' RNA ligase